jgi:hypothetical protein
MQEQLPNAESVRAAVEGWFRQSSRRRRVPFLFGAFVFGQAKRKVLAKRRNTDNQLKYKQNKEIKLESNTYLAIRRNTDHQLKFKLKKHSKLKPTYSTSLPLKANANFSIP